MTEKNSPSTVGSQTQLREIIGETSPMAVDKVMPKLDGFARQFIGLSPFLCLGSSDAEGKHDVSPRGDPPGFVKVVDDITLVIPDRPGNRRVDSMVNFMTNPRIGLIFFVPGIEETLRVSGRAQVTDDAQLLADTEVNGKVPKVGILVAVEEVFFQCAKALRRSQLWNPESQIERTEFPSMAQIVRDQRRPDMAVEELQKHVEHDYTHNLY